MKSRYLLNCAVARLNRGCSVSQLSKQRTALASQRLKPHTSLMAVTCLPPRQKPTLWNDGDPLLPACNNTSLGRASLCRSNKGFAGVTQGSSAVLCLVSYVHNARYSNNRTSAARRADEPNHVSAKRIRSPHSRLGLSSANSMARHSCSCVIRLCRKLLSAACERLALSARYFAAMKEETVSRLQGFVTCRPTRDAAKEDTSVVRTLSLCL